MNPGNAWSAYAASAGDSTTVWPTAAPPDGAEQPEGTSDQPANSSMVSRRKKAKPRLNFI